VNMCVWEVLDDPNSWLAPELLLRIFVFFVCFFYGQSRYYDSVFRRTNERLPHTVIAGRVYQVQ